VAIKWIDSDWQNALKTASAMTRNGEKRDRVYIDFRQRQYPVIAGTPTFTEITSGNNWSGTHDLTGGYAKYLLDMPTKFTLDIRASAEFTYNTGSDQPLASWYVDGTHYCIVDYEAASDKIRVRWVNGGTVRTLYSEQYDDGTSYTDIATISRITVVIDTTTGSDSGSALYVNGTLQDSTWSGAIDARDVRLPIFALRYTTAEGDWDINTVRLFSGYLASANDVSHNFRDVDDEEVVWYLNGEAVGRTRCNVTDFVLSIGLARSAEDPDTGSLVANRASIELKSESGEFADDQYAAFDPAAHQYNGTSAQRYMTKRPRVFIETWYDGEFEPLFVGRVEGSFRRSTVVGDISRVHIDAADQAAELATRYVRKGRYWENKDLVSATESNSLLHLITRVATQKEIYQYLGNSSFENATVTNSWAASGGTLTRQSDPLLGSYCGQLANASGSQQTVKQTVTFTGDKSINVDEKWTFSVYLKSAGAAAADIRLEEHDSSGINGTASTTAYSLSGGEGWVKYEVTRTIADSTSDRLVVAIEVDNDVTLKLDAAMLTQVEAAPDWYVENTTDGAAGVCDADDAVSDSYDTCGFISTAVAITHPWARIERGSTIWEQIKQLADACIAYKCGFTGGGALEFAAVLESGYSDPSPILTIDKMSSMDTTLDLERANKIIVHGTKILKDTYARTLWSAASSGVFGTAKAFPIYVNVADDAYFPDKSTFGEFVAKYGEVD